MVMVAMAFAFGRFLTIEGVPSDLAALITNATTEPIAVLLLLNLVLLVAGMFLEPVAAIIILAPILLPIAQSVGVDPIHFGIIMTCNLTIGFCTPPVGINLFVASSIAKVPVEDVIRRILPFMVAMFISMALVLFVPELSLLFI
ncbi:TRAP dicarboxylate transporter subunit DctM [Nitratireductor basaltis]|uniref:TRAP dicarboxylate transporter subunit DctM n=1 Tax=Nitratireductor basaltis TaxID=472175 RepID=A0A084UES4_9HYPH|nr:TRAP dicarboxylate transporter subunit DctM [Nitratireductor basaltis]